MAKWDNFGLTCKFIIYFFGDMILEMRGYHFTVTCVLVFDIVRAPLQVDENASICFPEN